MLRTKRIASAYWPLLLFMAAFLLLSLFLLATVVNAAEQVVLTFETDAQGNELLPGQVIDDEFHTTEGVSITIKADSFAADGSNVRAIFPSSDPPVVDGDVIDPDLGSPNRFCEGGGPGVGEGGRPGEPGENCTALGNILIIPTVGDADNDGFIDAAPDDDARGGVATYIFSQPVTIDYLEILDQEAPETADFFLYSSREATPANLIAQFSAMALGDNSFQRLTLTTDNVMRMDVEYEGSGGLAALAYTPGEPTAVSLSALGVSSASAPVMPLLVALILLTGLTMFWVLPIRRV